MTSPAPPSLYRLDDFDLIACEGRDAEAFLQAQLASDVRELADDNAQWTTLLTPQGRVIALMLLVRVDADRFVLAVPHRMGEAVSAAIGKFILRRKLTLKIDTARALYGSDAAVAIEGLTTLQLAIGGERQLHLGSRELSSSPAPASWKRADLETGIPWLPLVASEKHLAHSLGLQRLPALSLKKGCYPGQEIVARTHYLGRNKRALYLVQFGDVAEPGAQLRDGEGQLAGELVAALATIDGTLALAILSDDRADASLSIQGDGAPIDAVVLRRFDSIAIDARATG